MNYRYITIEREYGSGGTRIARMLAERMGIPCYGHEILEAVSKKYDIPVERIQQYEESASNSFLYSLYMMSQTASGNADLTSMESHLYVAEQEAILRLAAGGRAIFLGHCASEALKEYKGVIKVFIRCGDEKEKKKRILEDYGIEETKADVVRRKFDKKRANYYHVNTMKRWEDPKNYDIVLDSGSLGLEGCLNILEGLEK